MLRRWLALCTLTITMVTASACAGPVTVERTAQPAPTRVPSSTPAAAASAATGETPVATAPAIGSAITSVTAGDGGYLRTNPGEPGNVVISGHVSLRGDAGVFNRLGEVRVGDEILVSSASGQYRYLVESFTVVPENDLSVFLQLPYEQLTLMTCVADGEFKHRLVIRARPA
jgi:LPXTG-site transpeptidase (sortase) family protein